MQVWGGKTGSCTSQYDYGDGAPLGQPGESATFGSYFDDETSFGLKSSAAIARRECIL